MIKFASDTHFGHANVLEFCGRPWGTVEEMNDALVDANGYAPVSLDEVLAFFEGVEHRPRVPREAWAAGVR